MTGPGISVSQGGGEGDSGGVWWHWCHWMEKETKGCGLCCSASLLFLSRLHVHSRAWKGLVVVILKPSPPPTQVFPCPAWHQFLWLLVALHPS